MMSALAGLKILVPESRELDLFARMLEDEGAAAMRCPLVQICDLEDISEAQAWIEQVIAGAFTDIIWLTGEGLRRLEGRQRLRRRRFAGALERQYPRPVGGVLQKAQEGAELGRRRARGE
jgi:uroporphyrinogen-III synthase